MRVHQLLAALSYGDAIGNEALAIQRQLRAAGHESDIFAEMVNPRVAHLARPLWEYREVSSPDTVCIFHFSIGSAAGRLVHHAPDRLVIVYHNITPAHFFLGFHPHLAGLCHHGRRELQAFAPRTELALGDSELNRSELEEAGFGRTAVLPIVLDLSLYDRRPSPVVRKLYDDGRVNVLFVGRIIPNKRIDDLVRSFAVFQKWVRPRSRLLLVGDHRGFERYYDRLQELVRELRLDEVVFTGQVDDDELYAYYRLADVFLCLSEHEGFGVPLQEAMHFGLPVIAYDAGAVRETLRGGGLLLQDKRPEVVADLLDRLTRGGDLRRAVLASQADAIAGIRSTDFGALLRERLSPVLGSLDPRGTRVALGNDLSRPALSRDANGSASAPRQGPGEGLFRSTVGPGEAVIPTSPVGSSEEGSAVEGREETGGQALPGALRNGQIPQDPAGRGSLG